MKTVIAFFLEADVANSIIDDVNKHLAKRMDPELNPRCINVKDEENRHGILNIEVSKDIVDLSRDFYKTSVSIKEVLDEVDCVHVDFYELQQKY